MLLSLYSTVGKKLVPLRFIPAVMATILVGLFFVLCFVLFCFVFCFVVVL